MFIIKYLPFRIGFIALFAACLVLFPHLLLEQPNITANAQSTRLPTAYVGVWQGNGVQSNRSEWSILIALTPGTVDSVVGTIAYPSLACGGELTLRSINNQSIELFENLTYVGNCINRGTVTLQAVSDRRLQYKWFSPNGRQDATGVVQKISQ